MIDVVEVGGEVRMEVGDSTCGWRDDVQVDEAGANVMDEIDVDQGVGDLKSGCKIGDL